MSTDRTPPRWYVVSREGLATLCNGKADAQAVALECNVMYPRSGPHRALLLGEVQEPPAIPTGDAADSSWGEWQEASK